MDPASRSDNYTSFATAEIPYQPETSNTLGIFRHLLDDATRGRYPPDSWLPEVDQPVTFYMTHEGDSPKIGTAIKLLGYGGSKKIVEVNETLALMIPNARRYEAKTHAYWTRLVQEELALSDLLGKIGLLALRLSPTAVSTITEPDLKIPTYTTDTFAGLLKQGIFVLEGFMMEDEKDGWSKSKRLFESEEIALNPANWISLFEDLVDDVHKLIAYNIPTGLDSMHRAIVRTPKGYRVRYFGFDFASKKSAMIIPSDIPSVDLRTVDPSRISGIIRSLITAVVRHELPKLPIVKSDELIESLVTTLTPLVNPRQVN